MNKTKIEWCDYTWNPIVGCSPVSAGCANCYAAAISRRFGLPWGSAHFMPDRLDQPAAVRKPSRVFVCSMTDIGHETVKEDWRMRIWGAMDHAPQHTYIILTKRPDNLRYTAMPPRLWVGVTVEDLAALARWDALGHAWQGTTVVSVEPMLEPVSFASCDKVPDWVIAGPETGPKARPCDDAWIDALADESPCFFDKRKTGWTRREFPLPNANITGGE